MAVSILTLPSEVLFKIVEGLNFEDVVNLKHTRQRFSDLLSSEKSSHETLEVRETLECGL